MDAAMLTLGVLGVAAFLFATEIIPLAVTAMGAAIALGLHLLEETSVSVLIAVVEAIGRGEGA